MLGSRPRTAAAISGWMLWGCWGAAVHFTQVNSNWTTHSWSLSSLGVTLAWSSAGFVGFLFSLSFCMEGQEVETQWASSSRGSSSSPTRGSEIHLWRSSHHMHRPNGQYGEALASRIYVSNHPRTKTDRTLLIKSSMTVLSWSWTKIDEEWCPICLYIYVNFSVQRWAAKTCRVLLEGKACVK